MSDKLSPSRFSWLPRYWVNQGGASKLARMASQRLAARKINRSLEPLLSYPSCGAVIAALKLYILFGCMADDKRLSRNVGPGCLKTTYDELQHYLGMSRAMVRQGLALLELHGAVERLEFKPLVYRIPELVKPEGEGWAGVFKIPKGHLFGLRRHSKENPIALADFPNRGQAAMNALVLYLILLSVCQRDDNIAYISYSQMGVRAYLSNNEIRRALDVLINGDLISVLRVTNEATFEALGLPTQGRRFQGAPNVYLLKGIHSRRGYNQRINTPEDYKRVSDAL